MKLTPEQLDIVYADNDYIYVSARAGTGKTKTLLEYVKVRKKETFLYIVYNSSIKEEALSKFPSYVTIHTIHSLAREYIGYKYQHKLTKNIKTEDIFHSLEYFKNKNISNEKDFKEAFIISSIINRFCNSSFKKIEEIPHEEKYLKLAQEYWNKMIDLKNQNVFITFDGYLKLFHLNNPILDYDYILVDEAQDSNEVMLDIVYSQNSKKIFVGDEHQRIYSFRGAMNVFNDSKHFNPESDYSYLSLTKSFRFGKEIASVANKLLSFYKQEDKLLKGSEERNSIVGNIDKTIQYTTITRTNAKLFDLAVKFAKEGKSIAINGGIEFLEKQILDIYHLYKGELDLIESETIKKFKTYKKFKGIAENLKYPEYLFLVRIIEKYGDSLKENLILIKKYITGIKTADRILTTAHKSKGLEFVSVLIEEDFINLFDKNGILIPVDRINLEEINLLYVAITRATHEIELSEEVKLFLKQI